MYKSVQWLQQILVPDFGHRKEPVKHKEVYGRKTLTFLTKQNNYVEKSAV